MDKLKRYLKYVIWILLFYVFSNFLINLYIGSSYHNLGRRDNLSQVTVYQAQATKVNGRIKGDIRNLPDSKVSGKYLKIDLYSERGVNLGHLYVDVSGMQENETKSFEEYFKAQDVDYYELSFVDEKDPQGELLSMVKDLTRSQVFWGTFLALLILW